MSTFATVLCFVLIAAPLTSAYGSLTDQYTEKANKVITTISTQYEDTKLYVDAVVSQTNLESAGQWDSRFDPQDRIRKCYNFLSEHIQTNRARVVQCSADSVKAVNKRRNLMQKTFQDAVTRIRTHTCLNRMKPVAYLLGDETKLHFQCWPRFNSDMLKVQRETSVAFLEHVRNANTILRNWISTAGRCVAISENPSQEAEWRLACQPTNDPESHDRKATPVIE